MIMAITKNPSSIVKMDIIIFTLTFFKPFRRGSIGTNFKYITTTYGLRDNWRSHAEWLIWVCTTFWTIFLYMTIGRHSCQTIFFQVLFLLLTRRIWGHSKVIHHGWIFTYINKKQMGSWNNLVFAFEGGRCLYLKN
jgi:hypothetical protein